MVSLKNVILTLEQADKLKKWGFNVSVKNNTITLERD